MSLGGVAAAWGLAGAAACGDAGESIGVGVLLTDPMQVVSFARDSLATAVPGVELITSGAAPGSALTEPHETDTAPLAGTVARAVALAAEGAAAVVVGPPSSTEALLVAPILGEAGIPLIVPTSTSRQLATAGPLVFLLAPNDSVEGEFLARHAVEVIGARTATIFHVVDSYGAGLDIGTAAALERRGVRVLDRVPVRVDLGCSSAAGDPWEILVEASLLRGVPDVVIVAARHAETVCLAEALARRHPGLPVLAGDGTPPPATLRPLLSAAAAAALHVVTFWDREQSDRARAFARRFEARFGRPPSAGDALAWDALQLAAQAAIAGGGRPRRSVAWLRALGETRPAWEGVTGPIGFGGNAPPRPIHLVRVGDGAAPLPRSR